MGGDGKFHGGRLVDIVVEGGAKASEALHSGFKKEKGKIRGGNMTNSWGGLHWGGSNVRGLTSGGGGDIGRSDYLRGKGEDGGWCVSY